MTPGSPAERRMTTDATWNYGALAVTATVGAVVTFVIAGALGADTLGAFTQLYAVHVIGAQIAVFGAHDSTQKHVAECAGQGGEDAAIVPAALGLVLLSATALAGVICVSAGPVGAFVDSQAVGRGLYLVAPGIVLFSLNKVLFAALNGRGRLRRYALAQILRAGLVLVAVVTIVASGLPGYAVGGIFTTAELILLPCLFALVRPSWRRARDTSSHRRWWRQHATFGGRGLVNGILMETHLRVDVLTLSYFVSDRAVGVYAFAALFAEGVYQVPVVIRTVAYPTVVQFASRGDRGGLAAMMRRLSMASGLLCACAATAVALVYSSLASTFDVEFVLVGLPVLYTLLAGMTVYAFFVPFDQLLLQSGRPGRQSLLMALYVGVNVVLNLVLIPRFGLLGAAWATTVSLLFAGLLLLAASWAWLGYRGGVLLHRATVA
jgi:O-antigen/teichoic acid export membrane protein